MNILFDIYFLNKWIRYLLLVIVVFEMLLYNLMRRDVTLREMIWYDMILGMNKLKKVALNVIAEQLTEREIEHLKAAFNRIDVNGKPGQLTFCHISTIAVLI